MFVSSSKISYTKKGEFFYFIDKTKFIKELLYNARNKLFLKSEILQRKWQ